MRVEGFFESLGEAFGSFIRFIVDALSGVITLLAGAVAGFIDGMAGALGVTPSLLSIAVLLIGLILLYSAVRSFMRGSVIGGLIWLFLGLWLLTGLIR